MPPAPASDRTSPPGRARVVMMVANDIRHDSRVLKEGLALADGGVEVTLLGIAASGVREESRLGPVRIVRVPAATRMRDAETARRRARRRPRLNLAPDRAIVRAAGLDLRLRREDAELAGRVAQLRFQVARARALLLRVRSAADQRSKAAQDRFWTTVEARASEVERRADWRHHLPEVGDYELALGPELDRLEWDVLHAHDVHLVGVAAHAVARRHRAGRPAAWVYDAHELVSGIALYGARTRRWRAAALALEKRYIHRADAVVTVTDALAAELVAEHGLRRRPAVVMNSPVQGARPVRATQSVREDCKLADDVPLLLYSGGVTAARGVDTAVAALPRLPGVHLAVVAVPHTRIRPVQPLRELAESLGVADRLHLLDPVSPEQVSAYVAGADVGVHTMLHFPNHEVALPNKLFEYLHGGLPVLVSDCRALAGFVREHEVGRVFRAGDVDSFVAEAQALLAERAEVRASIDARPNLLDPYSWDRQATALRDVYRGLLGTGAVAEPSSGTRLAEVSEVAARRDDRPSVLGIGPANMAGQAWAWAKAVEREVPGASTYVLTVDRGNRLVYPCDELVPGATYRRDAAWSLATQNRAMETWTHALLEAGRPIFGRRNGSDVTGDVRVLRGVGIDVGLVLHGSEIRDPRRNAERTPWSPFRDPSEPLTERLQANHDTLLPIVEAFDGPVFVSTPDLLVDVPGAIWLPVVVDLDRWATDRPVLERDRPVVLHAPSRASIKGTAHVEAAMEPLVAEGLVEYRRLEGVDPAEMPAAVADADIVLDQFALGIYGAMAVEAMAAGRVVVSHVMRDVRERCPRDLPIVEAEPDRLADVVRGLVEDRQRARDVAAAGLLYAREFHDGRRSAEVLREHLGVRGRDAATRH